MPQNRSNSNMWKMIRIFLIGIVILSLLASSADAGKNKRGKKKDRRSKKHAEIGEQPVRPSRRHRREGRGDVQSASSDIANTRLPTLIQLYKRMDHKKKATAMRKQHVKPQHISDEAMIEHFRDSQAREDDGPLPTTARIQAKASFLLNPRRSPHLYLASTASSVTATQADAVSVHSASGIFGIHSRSEDVFGRVIHLSDAGRSNSHFGCNRGIANKADIPKDEPWVALVSRGHCSFFTKIKLAERHNASAVIVYDNKEGDIPEMFTLGTNIVAIAISQEDGQRVTKLADSRHKLLVSITIDNGEAEKVVATTTAPDNGSTTMPIMTSLLSLFAVLAILFQSHVMC